MITIFTPSDLIMFNMGDEQRELDFCSHFSKLKSTQQKISIRNTSKGTVTVSPSQCSIQYEDRKFDFAILGMIEDFIKGVVYGSNT